MVGFETWLFPRKIVLRRYQRSYARVFEMNLLRNAWIYIQNVMCDVKRGIFKVYCLQTQYMYMYRFAR